MEGRRDEEKDDVKKEGPKRSRNNPEGLKEKKIAEGATTVPLHGCKTCGEK